jgi:hypothetical protein
MKNKLFLMGIISILLLFGLVLVGCGDKENGDPLGPGGGGVTGKITVTVSNISGSQLINKYLLLYGQVGSKTYRSMATDGKQYFQVTGGSIEIPIRDVTGLFGSISTLPPVFIESGSGTCYVSVATDVNGTGSFVVSTISLVPFTNGNAEITIP